MCGIVGAGGDEKIWEAYLEVVEGSMSTYILFIVEGFELGGFLFAGGGAWCWELVWKIEKSECFSLA